MIVTAELVQARKSEAVDLPDSATGFDLLRRLNLAVDAHLVVRGDTPIPLDEPLVDRERIRVLSVVSGGASSG
ncbi:MAG TPA: thiamine biosynthesis protein ThiS [Thermoplasmata archaeon]|nr:thiamine biosynthesis protein ThiS [Thermoplasmata archaeon]